MPRTVYATTRAGWADTKAIAKGKMLQQLETPSTAAAGMLSEPSTTNGSYFDTELKSLQKILLALQP